MAEAVGVTREHWGRYERGMSMPGGEVLAVLAAKGIDINYILTGQRVGEEPAPAPPKYVPPPPDEEWLLDAYRHSSTEVRAVIMGATKAAALAARGAMPASPRRKAS